GETMQVPVFGEGSAIADVLADLPLEVRVEAGSVTLPARAWAAMGNGDVVVLDRRVGESVTLRVGGKIVGRGELVDVDGQLGVRLIERAT
ncbi:MAG: FliM/FliN family flagellar motor switch protein, partial [Polyangiales bacterium]